MASRLDDLIREHAERLDQLAGPIDLTDVISAPRNDTTNVAVIDIDATWAQREGRHHWPIIAVAAAAVVALVVGGLMIARRTDDPTGEVPADQPTTVAPTTTVDPRRETGGVEGGTLKLTYIVPDGWENIDNGVIKRDPTIGMNLVGARDNFYTSFCRTTSGEIDAAPVGPTVDDLVSAWANLPGVDATAAKDVTIDGFDGKQIEFTIPDHPEEGCNGMYFRCSYGGPEFPNGPISCSRLLPGIRTVDTRYNRNLHQKIWVLDVDGFRLMIMTASSPDASPQDRAALDEVVASIEID